MPAKDPAAYMREYRKRQRENAEADGAAAAPFDFQDIDLAAIAAPSAGELDAVAVPVWLSDAQFSKVAALMRAARARHGSTVAFDDAIRLAVEVAHRAIVGNGAAP